MSMRTLWRLTIPWAVGGLVATCAACSVAPSAVPSATRTGSEVQASLPADSSGTSPAGSAPRRSESAGSRRPGVSASTASGHPTAAKSPVLTGAAAPHPCGLREPAGTPPAGPDPNYPAAVQQAKAELLAAPVLPGSVLVPRPPSPAIAQGEFGPSRATTVCATRWYTAPGTPAHALAILRRELGGSNGAGLARGPGIRVDYLSNGDVQIGVTAVGRGVGIVVVVQVQWNRTRPESTKLGTVTGRVDIDITRTALNPQPTHTALPSLHRTLAGPAAQGLAALLDALSLEPYAAHSCPMGDGTKTDRIEFHSKTDSYIVTVVDEGCVWTTLIQGANDPVSLSTYGGEDIDRWLITELGLPHKYSMHP